ncbi:transcriptional adaptor 2 [Tothia fuscella]|uniref:Transcriptional adapter 2 n=1 Tax=Tothia fuscella TaxID=1048955 RepID=A0A9P4NSL6_9PEZI|nr:transcriptional adaptor 2 [Tothia fuscella]
MGMIKKKTAIRGTEGGVKYVCDVCSSDVTATVRIHCDICTDYDLCVPCFTSARHTRDHQPATHPYKVIEQHSIPIYTSEWGADEELLLLEGAETYGLGSWADIADHIGGCRTKEEVRDHYISTYVQSPKFPLPLHASKNDRTFIDDIPREEFQARKKRRIEERKEATKNAPPAQPKQKPTASVPACHEVQGYMPGRLEFETEYFNEAEEAVQHMQFEPGDSTGTEEPSEFGLKMAIMEIYNERLTARVERKKIIFEHNLLEYKKNQAIDKKRTKEQRDLFNKTKPFARMMTRADWEVFTQGLEEEHALRHAIGQLQEFRQMQITSLAAGAKYEIEKAARAAKAPGLGQFDRLASTSRLGKPQPAVDVPLASTAYISPELSLRPWNGLQTPPPSEAETNNGESHINGVNGVVTVNGAPNGTTNENGLPNPLSKTNPTLTSSSSSQALTVAPLPNLMPLKFDENTPDLHLLTPEEIKLCEVIRVFPGSYAMIKDTVLREAMNHGGGLKKKQVREVCKLDASKGGRIFDFFVQAGWIGKA